MSSFYITTAIDYINGQPHLGHAYEKIGADVLSRYKKQAGSKVFLLVGTDEHSTNVVKGAQALGLEPKLYCDQMAVQFQELCRALNVAYDRFIRTTEDDHKFVVQKVVAAIWEAGYIRKDTYSGLYCESCEAFLQKEQLTSDRCPNHPTKELVWVHEENYFFRLSHFQKQLVRHIDEHPEFIEPESRRNEIKNRLHAGLRDISISRVASNQWGIPFPQDDKHVVYVWFDALINYLSGAGYYFTPQLFVENWPADVQIIGKDITWFHCVVWPAILLALGLPLPKKVFGHGFIQHKGQKLSKSSGLVIDPFKLTKQYGTDVLRFYLLRVIPWGQDGNFSIEGLETTYNNDLANDYGNLISRTTAMIDKFTNGYLPNPIQLRTNEIEESAAAVLSRYHSLMAEMQYADALNEIMTLVKMANHHIDQTAPWQLFTDQARAAELAGVLYNLVEVIRISTWMLQPFMPSLKNRVWEQLGLDCVDEEAVQRPCWGCRYNNVKIKRGEPLFPRIKS